MAPGQAKFIYVLSGVLVLVEDGETPLGPRDAAGLPAAHSLENRSTETVVSVFQIVSACREP